jgi:hypothetical protein
MTRQLIAMVCAVGAALLAGTTQAAVIAGWDFSQYKVPGDESGGGSPLPANYSYYDGNGAGTGANAIGEATFSGSAFVPTAGEGRNCERLADTSLKGCAPPNVDGPIRSNRSDPFDVGQPSFDAFSLLLAEGQTYANRYAMKATNSVDVVFRASAPGGASDWIVSFGGKVLSGGGSDGGEVSCAPSCGSTVTVEFSTDGISYTSYSSASLTPDDQRFEIALDTAVATEAYVRLGLSAASGEPVIDNVAIEAIPVPEPGGLAQLMAGVAGLFALRRFRG